MKEPKKKVLIVNDDGLHSTGMMHLEQELSADFEVWAVCPDRERSATSQAITIRETLRLTHVQGRHYHVNGFPADCVNVALYCGLFPRFDLVVSGINHGVNLGDDVHYSGTVGAARHAAVHRIVAVAVSCINRDSNGSFRRPARWLRDWLRMNLEHLKQEMVYNINYPFEPTDLDIDAGFPEAEVTKHGRRQYLDAYELLEESASTHSTENGFPLSGRSGVLRLKETIMGSDVVEGTDFFAIEHGRVSITPLSLKTYDREEMDFLRNLMMPA